MPPRPAAHLGYKLKLARLCRLKQRAEVERLQVDSAERACAHASGALPIKGLHLDIPVTSLRSSTLISDTQISIQEVCPLLGPPLFTHRGGISSSAPKVGSGVVSELRKKRQTS